LSLSDRLAIVPIAVDDKPTTWVATIRAICPPFEDVYTRSPWVQSHFQYWGIGNSGRLLTGYSISGSEVRNQIAEGGNWKSLVPPAVAATLESVDGPRRIQALLQGSNYRITTADRTANQE